MGFARKIRSNRRMTTHEIPQLVGAKMLSLAMLTTDAAVAKNDRNTERAIPEIACTTGKTENLWLRRNNIWKNGKHSNTHQKCWDFLSQFFSALPNKLSCFACVPSRMNAWCIVFVFLATHMRRVYLPFHRCVVLCAMGGVANLNIYTYFIKIKETLGALRLRLEWELGMNGKSIETNPNRLRHGKRRQISLNFSSLLELVQQSNSEYFGPKWISLSEFGRFLFSLSSSFLFYIAERWSIHPIVWSCDES